MLIVRSGAAMILVREVPLLAAAHIIGISGTRLWWVIQYYMHHAFVRLELSGLEALARVDDLPGPDS